MSTTLQSEKISDSKPTGRPISYRVTTDATLKQLWPFLALAGLYLACLTVIWRQNRPPIIFDPLSILLAVFLPMRMMMVLFQRRQRHLFQQCLAGAETLLETPPAIRPQRRALFFSRLLCLGLVVLLVLSLRLIATMKAPQPALWWFYPPFLLVQGGAMLVTTRAERTIVTTRGLVPKDRIFRTFYPWASLKELTWISNTKKLRIECQDIPGWRTIPLGHLSDADRNHLLDLLQQHAPLQRA
ncbi:MAG: hypothetical protein U0903_09415 [Planctomycetales bacterium]